MAESVKTYLVNTFTMHLELLQRSKQTQYPI
jgi:hypothetical protein